MSERGVPKGVSSGRKTYKNLRLTSGSGTEGEADVPPGWE